MKQILNSLKHMAQRDPAYVALLVAVGVAFLFTA